MRTDPGRIIHGRLKPIGGTAVPGARGARRSIVVFLSFCSLLQGPPALGAPGDLDPGFGVGGKVITSFGTGNNYAYGVAIQSDGKIVVTGSARDGTNNKFSVARYNADGTLDSGFGNGGTVMTAFGTSYDEPYAMALQADGKIVVAGYTRGTTWDFALARYEADGKLDTGFGAGGKVITPVGTGSDIAYAVAIQPDGKIVAAGTASGTTLTFALVRYNADGGLDSSFGSGGKVVTQFGAGQNSLSGVAIQSDGKIVAAGSSNSRINDYTTSDFALLRYNADGTLDESFGTGGKVITAVGTGQDTAYAVATQSDGKIVAAGKSGTSFAVLRYNSNGTLDAGFGSGGKVLTAAGASASSAQSVVIQSDGRIVAAGTADKVFAAARYNADGALDAEFGTNGRVLTDVGTGDDVGRAVAIQADGKLVVAGYAGNSTSTNTSIDVAMVRYNANGTLDTSFGSVGKVTTDIGTNGEYVSAMALQSDGKVIVAGYSHWSDSKGDGFALARFNADGTPDAAFGSGGKVNTYLSSSSAAYAVTIQPDGKIVAAGYEGTYTFTLVRY
ncbi:MAG: hypothetical protein HYY28_08565, partial [Betaproteobacteria bacterium]|nr:hypothetical protein [Betaproteobacteria bacterium]